MVDLPHRASRHVRRDAPVPAGGAPPPSFRPAWWVPGPHGQTIYGKVVRRPPHAPIRAER